MQEAAPAAAEDGAIKRSWAGRLPARAAARYAALTSYYTGALDPSEADQLECGY